MRILKAIWLIIATCLAGAVIAGAVIAFGIISSAIGVLLAGALLVAFIWNAWREYRSNRKPR